MSRATSTAPADRREQAMRHWLVRCSLAVGAPIGAGLHAAYGWPMVALFAVFCVAVGVAGIARAAWREARS